MLRIVFVFGWAMVIFICTCTSSLENLVETNRLQFTWTSNPDLTEMLAPLPSGLTPHFITRKIGHAFVFFILTIGIYLAIPASYLYGFLAFFYAVATEVLQLFFMRDGRFFDVAFDSAGIVAAVLIVEVGSRLSHRYQVIPEKLESHK